MWTIIRPKQFIIILCIFLLQNRVMCYEKHDEKRPDCSTLGGKCIDKANDCKGLVLHGYSFKSKVNCMCCISLKDDEKIHGPVLEESIVKKPKSMPKSSSSFSSRKFPIKDDENNRKPIYQRPVFQKPNSKPLSPITGKAVKKIPGPGVKQPVVKKTLTNPRSSVSSNKGISTLFAKNCANKMKKKCKDADGSCRKNCKNGEEEIPNGCKSKANCKCCAKVPTRTCDPSTKCTQKGGTCANGCGKGFNKLNVKCPGKSCVCCKPKPCTEDPSCTANGGKCVLSEDNCKPAKGRIFGTCNNGNCQCCIPKGECASVDEFECASNQDNDGKKAAECVSASYECDKDNDCKDKSDEKGCVFAENLSCYWCKTWEGKIGANEDINCKNSNYDGNTEVMEWDDPFVGCATKVYINGDVWRGFQSWQRNHINNNTECEFGFDYEDDEKTAYRRCWCKNANCNNQLCENCVLRGN